MADANAQPIDVLAALPDAMVDAWLAEPDARYHVDRIDESFPDAAALRSAVAAGDPSAIGSLLCLLDAHDRDQAAHALGRAILGDPGLTRDPILVLVTIRVLIQFDDEATFRELMPFVVHRYQGGWLSIDECPVERRAALACEYLEQHRSMVVDPPLRWPTLDQPEDAAIPDDDPTGFTADHEVLIRLYPAASATTQERMRALAWDLFSRASNRRARGRAAQALVAMGQQEVAWILAESADPELRDRGFRSLLSLDPWACLSRFAACLADAPPGAAGRARQASLRRAIDGHRSGLGMVALPGGGWWIVVRSGDRWTLADLQADGSTSPRRWLVEAPESGSVQRITPSLPASARGRWRVVAYIDRFAEEHRLYVPAAVDGESPDDPVPFARTRAELDALLRGGRASSSKAPRQTESRTSSKAPRQTEGRTSSKAPRQTEGRTPSPEPVAPAPDRSTPDRPTPARSSKTRPASRYEPRPVGRTKAASSGRVAVPGHTLVGLFDTEQQRFVCTPPGAVKIVGAGEHAVAWILERREGASGIARGDYDWRIEWWPLEADRPEATHVVQDRLTIEWCWPAAITCAKRSRHRIAVLDCRSEDDRVRLYVVRRPTGELVETRERDEAERLARG